MTAQALIFDPEIYGSYARSSAAADYIELLLLNARDELRRSTVVDWIEDGEWASLFGPTFTTIGTERTALDAVGAAGTVFDRLTERADALGDYYPFDVTTDGARLSDREDVTDGYRFLLGICTAHAFKLDTPHDSATCFEAALERCVEGILGRSSGFRRHLGQGGFPEALKGATGSVHLTCASEGNNVIVSGWANDERADVISHLEWPDYRLGRWVFIGQATVAKSDRWDDKMGETSAHTWMKLILEQVPPAVYLAVPHHVEPHHWNRLVQNRQRVILDRLRLAPRLSGKLEEPELSFVELIANVEPEDVLPPM